MNQEYIITTEALTQRFGRTLAVNELTLKIPKGSLCALMGPNGAGKTTLIKMLLRMLKPTSGSATVLGTPISELKQTQFRKIGYVSENHKIPTSITAAQLFSYCEGIYPSWNRNLCEHLSKDLDLPLDQKLGKCSRGQRMKALLVSSIAFNPELLVLDEPFSGLDPLSREEFAARLLSIAH